MANRGYQEREIRLLVEWAGVTFPFARLITRYRIIRPPPLIAPGFTEAEMIRLLKPTGYMIDGVIIDGTVTYVVEAKTDNESQALGQLLYYVYLLKRYAELQEFRVDDVRPVLLFARLDRDLFDFAQGKGVAATVYSPSWIQEFLRS